MFGSKLPLKRSLKKQKLYQDPQRNAFWRFFCYIKPTEKHSFGGPGKDPYKLDLFRLFFFFFKPLLLFWLAGLVVDARKSCRELFFLTLKVGPFGLFVCFLLFFCFVLFPKRRMDGRIKNKTNDVVGTRSTARSGP